MVGTTDLAAALRDRSQRAVLSFPLTPFDSGGEVDLAAFRTHLRGQLAAGPAALFPCCGTGEFFSLSESEYAELVATAVREAGGEVPVIVGIGYGWAQAARFAAAAEQAEADGALLLPHYLVGAPQEGLVRQVQEVAARTSLPLIVYQRDQVKYTPAALAELARIPNVIGLKDGHGDLDQLQRLRLAVPSDFLFFNGVPTAELQARPYRSIGIHAYSSAVHAFAPEISKAFFTALMAGDDATVDRLLQEFYVPLVTLRDRQRGYAVALVKAAARLRGAPVGPVRAPLTDPTPTELDQLAGILTAGLALVGATLDGQRSSA
ncbi:5-dehydro-4-deoxyglucarate dehydratase [Actinopolymorpha alba]|uniref:5-dehydro-4-deoxyglucarate dehydratase n=1 Tax=Actinopolymorpha alba TaxID=533267 RepID=UPI00037EC7B1|nr:5-dehydro-4-deoxyglucarate dehydratase [Actinopolymorpha alba]